MTDLKLTTKLTAYSSGSVVTRAYIWEPSPLHEDYWIIIADMTLAEERSLVIAESLLALRTENLVEMLNATGGHQFEAEDVEHSFDDYRSADAEYV